MIVRNALALEAQVEERPLAKKQEELAEEEDKEAEMAMAAKAKEKGEGDNVSEEGNEAGPPDGGGGESAEGATTEVKSNGAAATGDHTQSDIAGKHHGHHHKKALLHNDDTELTRVGKVRKFYSVVDNSDCSSGFLKLLDEVHRQFYDAYDSRPVLIPKASNRGSLKPSRPYDTTVRIPDSRRLLLTHSNRR